MKEKNVKRIGIVLGICLFSIGLFALTYAYLSKILFSDINVNTTTYGLEHYITYSPGSELSGELAPSSSYTDGLSNETPITFAPKNNPPYNIYGHIYLHITSVGDHLKDEPALKYVVEQIVGSNSTVVAEGSLAGISSGNDKLLKGNILINNLNANTKYKVYIWLDEDNISSYDISGDSLNASIRCDATMKVILPT